MSKQSVLIFVAVLVGLGAGAARAQEHGHKHHAFPKDVDAFHSLLAPLWHSRPGPERSANACAKAAEMDKTAKAIRSADATPLIAALAAFASQCKADPAGIDPVFHDVHEAFHKLIDAKPPGGKR